MQVPGSSLARPERWSCGSEEALPMGPARMTQLTRSLAPACSAVGGDHLLRASDRPRFGTFESPDQGRAAHYPLRPERTGSTSVAARFRGSMHARLPTVLLRQPRRALLARAGL